jgi:polyhydroxyalkanoate synthesis regulator phasin
MGIIMDKPLQPEVAPVPPAPAPPAAGVPRRPGHRGADMRDTVAEMAERAQIISQEAGSKVAAAMKDVISAAAGLTGFAIESARDLVSYMVRRGQMTPEEADKLMREAEAAHDKRPASEKSKPTASKIAADRAAVAKAEAAARAAAAMAAIPPYRQHLQPAKPVVPPIVADKPAKPVVAPPAEKPAKAAAAAHPPVAKTAKPAKTATMSAKAVVNKTAKAKPPAKAAKPAAVKKKPKR